MPLLASLALAATITQLPQCEWDRNDAKSQFGGDVPEAVDRYREIPAAVREQLKQRMSSHRYDDLAYIGRHGIVGKQRYGNELRDMVRPDAQCAQVSRLGWAENDVELALVYCEGEYCLLVPTNGRNVSRATPLPTIDLADALAEMDGKPPAAGPVADTYAKGRILIEARAGLSDRELAKLLNVHGGQGRKLGGSNLYIVDLPPTASEAAVAALLSKHPHLKFAELDKRVAPHAVVNDPYTGSEWHLAKINAPSAWDASQGSGVTIAILDSGVDPSHPDLAASLVAGWNVYDNNSNTADVFGHGTKVAGSAAAASNNAVGVAGVAGQARIMPIRITDLQGYGYSSTMAAGLTWAADHGAKVANISFQSADLASVISAANYMRSKGGLVTTSAGNSGVNWTATPTSSMVVVSATDSNDLRTSWSNYGGIVSVSAPGAGIWTTVSGGGYGAVSGTSFAAPVTAGVIGLMMAAKPSLPNTQIESLLYSTSVDLGAAGRDAEYGHGRINAAAAVQAALSAVSTADTQAPATSISAPLASSTVSGLVAVNVNATDNLGVAKVELRVNGALIGTDTTAPYGFSWDTSKLANGMANVVSTAYDAAGNAGSSTTVAVNVANTTAIIVADVTPPTLSISNPKAGAKVSGNVGIQVAAADNNGAAGITQTLWIDGASVASSTGGTLSYNWNTRKVKAGTHTIQAVARDAAGNSATVSVQVSN